MAAAWRAEGQRWCALARAQPLVWGCGRRVPRGGGGTWGRDGAPRLGGRKPVLVAWPKELCYAGRSLTVPVPQFPQLN